MVQRSPAEEAALQRLLAAGAQADVAGEVEAYGPDPDQVVELYGVPTDPVVVVVHGGYFRPAVDRTHARAQAKALATEGFSVALAEYRRVPGDPAVSIADLVGVETFIGDVDLWVGHSAGGTLVLLHRLLGHGEHPDAAVLALAPVARLTAAAERGLGAGAVVDWVGAAPHDALTAYATLDPSLLGREAGHDGLLLVHGGDDVTAPPDQSTGSGLPHEVWAGAHHFDLVDPESPHWPRVVETVRRMARLGRSEP